MFGFRRTRAIVGLDIGSSAVKAVELNHTPRGMVVAALGAESLPVGAIVDGAIVDGGAVSSAIRRLFERTPFSTKHVAASLSGGAVIVKRITVPAMSDEELAESIRWEAEQHIPFDIQDVCLDYQVLEAASPGSPESIDVLLVAAKRDRIAHYTDVIRDAGQVPSVVDIDAFALHNAFEANYRGASRGAVILVNAGASAINLSITDGGQVLFTRDISLGGNAYTEAVRRDLGLHPDAADRAKCGEAVDGASPDDVRQVLRVVTDAVLLEIEKTFDFYKATAASDAFERVLISGGASLVDGFGPAIEERFAVPVEAFNPFRQIELDTSAVGAADAERILPTAAVAVGLALRRVGDR